ncbi:cytochrome c-type biogenesis protein CcmH [Nocardia sp. NRRL S-836]|uniref:cytochrome c-type biogenesis protein n=1 Tax=Nocardia sp. NRRL S-836 TaxID=1519492 RepID=UPI0006AE71E3|nr:cytochrome c-type biogenesis protein CcmH [Nocardia sp. NRRL S-836]
MRSLVLLAVAVLAFLAVISLGIGEASVEERAGRLSAELRCPTCQGISVADSPTPLAREINAKVLARLREGRSEDEVRAELVAAYGEWILLSPPKRGAGWLPWLLPVVVLAGGSVAAAVALRGREKR